MMPITLNGLEMNTGAADANGALWYATKLDGWSSSSIRQSTLEPTLRDGGLLTDARYGVRTLTLEGVCKAGTADLSWTSQEVLAALVPLFGPVAMVVSETVDKQVFVTLAGEPKYNLVGQGSFEWQLGLTAMDPRKYAVAPSSVVVAAGDTEVISVGGNALTYPKITTSGNVNLESDETDLVFLSTASMLAGTIIDMKERTAYAPGNVTQYHKVSPYAQWFPLVKGTNTIINSGSASATLDYYEAWV